MFNDKVYQNIKQVREQQFILEEELRRLYRLVEKVSEKQQEQP